MRPSSSPGAISSCSCFKISRKTPEAGAATSTVTLSVSISISGSFSVTASPGCFSQRNSCERVPSVCSAGALTSIGVLIRDLYAGQLLDHTRDARDVGHRGLEQQRVVGTWYIGHRQPFNRRVQTEKRLLRERSGNFRAK